MEKNFEIQGVSELALQEQLTIDGGLGPLLIVAAAAGGLILGLGAGYAVTKLISKM